MPERELRDEINRLRDWKHDHVDPQLAALHYRLKAVERRTADRRNVTVVYANVALAVCAIAALIVNLVYR